MRIQPSRNSGIAALVNGRIKVEAPILQRSALGFVALGMPRQTIRGFATRRADPEMEARMVESVLRREGASIAILGNPNMEGGLRVYVPAGRSGRTPGAVSNISGLVDRQRPHVRRSYARTLGHRGSLVPLEVTVRRDGDVLRLSAANRAGTADALPQSARDRALRTVADCIAAMNPRARRTVEIVGGSSHVGTRFRIEGGRRIERSPAPIPPAGTLALRVSRPVALPNGRGYWQSASQRRGDVAFTQLVVPRRIEGVERLRIIDVEFRGRESNATRPPDVRIRRQQLRQISSTQAWPDAAEDAQIRNNTFVIARSTPAQGVEELSISRNTNADGVPTTRSMPFEVKRQGGRLEFSLQDLTLPSTDRERLEYVRALSHYALYQHGEASVDVRFGLEVIRFEDERAR